MRTVTFVSNDVRSVSATRIKAVTDKLKSFERILVIGTPYEKPTVTKLTPEQAKLKLVSLASRGDQGAKDFLDKMFPASVPTTKSAGHRVEPGPSPR
jgi:hypothetical protein